MINKEFTDLMSLFAWVHKTHNLLQVTVQLLWKDNVVDAHIHILYTYLLAYVSSFISSFNKFDLGFKGYEQLHIECLIGSWNGINKSKELKTYVSETTTTVTTAMSTYSDCFRASLAFKNKVVFYK